MSYREDFVPGADAAFALWLSNLVRYVLTKTGSTPPAWDHIPADRVLKLRTASAEWDSAFQKTQEPHTPADTELKNKKRTAAEKEARAFIKQFLLFDPVTGEDRINMGIPNHDGSHTPIPAPSTRPEFQLTVKDTRLITLKFRDAGSSRRGKPYGIDGAVVRYSVLPTVRAQMPAEERAGIERRAQALHEALASSRVPKGSVGNREADEAFEYSLLATRSPYTLEFTGADEGMTAYVSLSWQNEKGQEGTMTDIQTCIIP